MPDLIVIDGGIGQVNAALHAFNGFKYASFDLLSAWPSVKRP